MTDDTATPLAALMQARRHIGPKHLVEPGPEDATLQALFDAAAQAPDHGRLRPWRFLVLRSPEARQRLAEAFAQALSERDPAADETQLADAREKALRGPVLLLAIARLRDADAQIPPEERLVSLGAALQNLLLAAQAQGYASGLSSGRAMKSRALREAFSLAEGEEAVCCITLGTAAPSAFRKPAPGRPRGDEVARWL